MNKNKSFLDDLNEEPNIIKKCWWKIQFFFDDWIYPAYYLRNLLFHRYNKIKLPMFKPYEYLDNSVRMKYAIFELVKDFIENEKPEKYICWYRDEKGNDLGHKYGEGEQQIIYKDLKGKYVMDLMKEIYNFYTKILPELEKEKEYLLDIWAKYIFNGHYKEDEKLKDVVEWIDEPSNYTLKDIENENLDWDILLKYIGKKEKFFEEDLIHNEYKKLKVHIHDQIQYYLHLAIDIREYFWT